MSIHKNKKGMYEYVLSKSIMLIFILGLVYVFYNFYSNLNMKSAGEVAEYEAERVAKIIDDTISYTGIETENIIILNNNLKVGQTMVSYDLVIDKGNVVLSLKDYPYDGVMGVGRFGQSNLEVADSSDSGCYGGKDVIECSWDEIVKGAIIKVKKTDQYKYLPEKGLYYQVDVTIESIDCMDTICLTGDWAVDENV